MNKLLPAIALSIALPAIAHAQATPAPAPKADCCEKMKAEGKDCCKDMDHAKMDHSKMDHSQHGDDKAADAHADHQN